MYYNSLNQKLRAEFGCKVYKLSLTSGLSCPNRDGKIDTRGCIFCSALGSGDFAEPFCSDITKQIENAKLRVKSKIKDGKYIAYFQSFTNTYGDIDFLESIFTQAINYPDVVALSIATRPDCLGDDVLSLLEKLAKIKPVWVELGLQTVNEKSVKYIRRGFKNTIYKDAVENLHKIGVEVVTHIILGLPNETTQDMLNTVHFVAECKTDGVKLQLLHILEDTDLATDYKNGKFSALTLDEYIDILCECISALPSNITIHRLTGDGDKKHLMAPLWSADKKKVLNQINKALNDRNIIQGSKVSNCLKDC